MAIPLFIEILGDDLKENDPIRRSLISTYRRQVDTLVRLQDEKSGLRNTLIGDKTSYVESSAAAGFAAGIYMGIRMVSVAF